MYKPELSKATPDNLAHLLNLFGSPSSRPTDTFVTNAEPLSPHLLMNVRQSGYVPSPRQLHALKRRLSITTGGVFKLFGYRLNSFRRIEEMLNGHRTRFVESYAFNRDRAIDLPEWLGGSGAFQRTAFLSEIVVSWQQGIPIRALRGRHWQRPGTLYAQVGTCSGANASRIPGSAFVALLPVGAAEAVSPNPDATYLLQTGYGYLCARCAVERGWLSLIAPARSYTGPQEFLYPGDVRIAGRVGSFGARLPVPAVADDCSSRRHKAAPLILPWEQPSFADLVASEHLRFGITETMLNRANEILEDRIGTGISARTIRRYETGGEKIPQTSTLIALALLHSLRMRDVLSSLDLWSDEESSYSLAMLMNTKRAADLPSSFQSARAPQPASAWEPLMDEWGEWPTLLSMAIPDLSAWGHRILRINQSDYYRGMDTLILAHSVAVLDVSDRNIPARAGSSKIDWQRPIYALRYDGKTYCSYVEGDSSHLFLTPHPSAGTIPRLIARRAQAQILGRLIGIASPL